MQLIIYKINLNNFSVTNFFMPKLQIDFSKMDIYKCPILKKRF